jgi:hypothetical protein
MEVTVSECNVSIKLRRTENRTSVLQHAKTSGGNPSHLSYRNEVVPSTLHTTMPMQQCSTINNYLMKIHMHLVATQAISHLVMKQYQAHYTI